MIESQRFRENARQDQRKCPALKLERAAEMRAEKRLLGFSVLYLFALFGVLVADRWIDKYTAGRVTALVDLKSALESTHRKEF